MTTLRTSELGLKLIEVFERDKLIGYKCPAGVATIGRGITGPALKEARLVINYVGGRVSDTVFIGGKITQAESDRLYRELVDFFENKVERLLGASTVARLEAHQFDALVSLAWNIGLGSLAKSTVLKKVKAGADDAVPQHFMSWNKAKVKGVMTVMSGLTRRRRAEAALWRGDLEDAESYAGMKFPPMPQQVEEPEPPKTMAESSIGQGTIIAGAGGTIAAGKEAADAIRETLTTGTDLLQTVLMAGPWVLLVLLIAAAAWYVWNERKRKLKEDLC